MKHRRFVPNNQRRASARVVVALARLYLLITALSALGQIGGLDLSFNPGTGANGNVWAMAVQPNGKVVIGGAFTSVNGVARSRVARLNPDGSLDTTFDPGSGVNGDVQTLKLDSSGRVLIGGSFSLVNGTNRNNVARLNANGSLDLTFNPGNGANGTVWALAVQTDTKILLGGEFTAVNANPRSGIARLTSSGGIDDTFIVGSGTTNGIVYALALQTDGKILLGGNFTVYNGTGRTNIARLASNGTIDATFNPGGGAGSDINSLGVQSDGKIIAGGAFTLFNGVSRKYVARLLTNGVHDTSFNIGAEPNNAVQSLMALPDDKILIAGDFEFVGGVERRYLARLNANGSLDQTFDPGSGMNNTVVPILAQADGRVFAGGYFTQVAAVSRPHVARLHNTVEGLSPRLIGSKSSGNFNVSFATLTNIAYLLEYSDSLVPQVWIPLSIVFGDGSIKNLMDTNPNVRQRFYRLRTLYSEPVMLNPRRIGNSFQTEAPAFAWRTMILEYKNSLGDVTWTSLPGVAGNNAVQTLTDSGATVPTRFYRVRAQ